MLLFKACPRCGGDIQVNRDIYGDYKECLQCGLMEDTESPYVRKAVPAAAKKRKKKVA